MFFFVVAQRTINWQDKTDLHCEILYVPFCLKYEWITIFIALLTIAVSVASSQS